MSLLEVEGAAVEFSGPGGTVRALDHVDLHVEQGEIVAVVGESGCGKTTLARAILGLQPLVSGQIMLQGRRVTGPSADSAAQVGMVWQDPYASLDPRWTVERSALEPAGLVGRQVDSRKLFEDVGLDPSLRDRYPHQMSGGQRQRVAIARAIALRPPLIVCDEPTAALDLSIRAQILNLLKDIQSQLGCSFLYISHDLATVRHLANRVAVMYLGRIVEIGPTESIFTSPKHPYSAALMESVPTLETLGQIPGAPAGEIPDPHHLPKGCTFAARCQWAQEVCRQEIPELRADGNREFACNFPLSQITTAP